MTQILMFTTSPNLTLILVDPESEHDAEDEARPDSDPDYEPDALKYHYIEVEHNDDLTLIIYSGCCTCQNRNAALSNVLLSVAVKSGRVIIQKYSEKGQTQMDCDSVHPQYDRKKTKEPNHPPTK